MGKSVTVLTLRSFEVQGQPYQAGSVVRLPALSALLLAREKKVTLSARAIREANASVRVPAVTLQASPVHEEPATSPAVEDEPRPKRSYKRRDMEAEKSNSSIASAADAFPDNYTRPDPDEDR